MPPRGSRAHSELSGHSMHDEDEEEEGATASAGGGSTTKGKGRKSNDKGGEDQRKIQNRLAQREFRQRKQQYIKDLEARVELASSSRDEQVEQLRSAVTGLIEENQRLRELLAGVGGFIGSGLGGILPTIGADLPEFESLISRKSSDRIHEILANGRREATAAAGGSQASPVAGPSGSGSAQKRQRTSDSPVDHRGGVDRGASTSSNGPAPIQRFELPPVAPAVLPQLPQYNYGGGAGSSASQLPPLPPAPYPVANVPFSSVRDTPATTADGMPLISTHETQEEALKRRMAQQAEVKHVADGMGLAPVQDLTQADHDKGVQALFTMPTDNPKLQAIQLISYHMRNKREQPNYHLPPSLKATVTQQTVPHSFFFDGIIFPSLRDRLILLKDQYDLQTLLDDLLEGVEMHENDILMPSNWELSEGFLRKYWYVIDAEVLSISNRWRRERGEPELTMRSIVPDGDGIVAEGALGTRPARSATA